MNLIAISVAVKSNSPFQYDGGQNSLSGEGVRMQNKQQKTPQNLQKIMFTKIIVEYWKHIGKNGKHNTHTHTHTCHTTYTHKEKVGKSKTILLFVLSWHTGVRISRNQEKNTKCIKILAD